MPPGPSPVLPKSYSKLCFYLRVTSQQTRAVPLRPIIPIYPILLSLFVTSQSSILQSISEFISLSKTEAKKSSERPPKILTQFQRLRQDELIPGDFDVIALRNPNERITDDDVTTHNDNW